GQARHRLDTRRTGLPAPRGPGARRHGAGRRGHRRRRISSRLMLYLWIALFGLIGTFARFELQALLQKPAGPGFPWGTLLVNVTGSLLVGFIARAGTGASAISPELRIGLLVGLCGGYTTFSGFSLEIVRMLQGG